MFVFDEKNSKIITIYYACYKHMYFYTHLQLNVVRLERSSLVVIGFMNNVYRHFSIPYRHWQCIIHFTFQLKINKNILTFFTFYCN